MEPDILPINIQFIKRCIFCDFTSLNDIAMEHQHLHNCHSVIIGKWICPVSNCNNEYTKKVYLNNHLIEKHCNTAGLRDIFYQCDSCDFIDTNKSIVANHMKNKIPQFIFQCYHCQQMFNCKKDLMIHFNSHSSTDDGFLYKCSECFFVSEFKHAYDFHVLQSLPCRAKNLKYVTICQDCI